MKNKIKRLSRSSVAFLVLLCMLFSIVAPTIAVAEAVDFGSNESAESKKDFNYVSVGDSMTNGYGFVGYDQGIKNQEYFNNGGTYNFFTGTGVYGVDAYPIQFEKYLNEQLVDTGKLDKVNHTKLALSAMRAEDFLYLIGGRESQTSDNWQNQATNYANCKTPEEIQRLKDYMINAVAEADLISLGLGNASFGAYFSSTVTSILGVFGAEYKGDDVVYLKDAVDEAVAEGFFDAKQKAVVEDVYNAVKDMLLENADPEMAEQYNIDLVCELLAYTTANFMISYKAVIERIYELNPDTDIMIVGLMNTAYGLKITAEGMDDIEIGDILDTVFGFLNTYTATIAAKVKEEKGADASTVMFAEQPEPKFVCQVFNEMRLSGWQDADNGRLSATTVRDRNISAYNGTIRELVGYAFYGNPGYFPEITLAMIQDIDGEDLNTWGDLEYYNFCTKYGIADPTNYIASALIYLGVEDAVAEAANDAEISLQAAMDMTGDGIMSVFTDFVYPENPLDTRAALAEYLNENARGLCKIYGLFKVGDGISVHPSPSGHDEIAKNVIAAYENKILAEQDVTLVNGMKAYYYFAENGYVTAEQALEVLLTIQEMEDNTEIIGVVYDSFIKNNANIPDNSTKMAVIWDILDKFRDDFGSDVILVTDLVKEICDALTEKGTLNDDKAFTIVDFAFSKILDGETTEDEVTEITEFAYTVIFRDDSVSAEAKIDSVEVLYTKIAEGYFGMAVPALVAVGELYAKLEAAELLTDIEAFIIIDYVFDRIIDGTLDTKDIVDIAQFVYNTVFYQKDSETVFSLAAGVEASELIDRLSIEEKIEVINIVFEVLDTNGYVESVPALEPVAKLYTGLKENGNITNAEIIEIVDLAFNSVVTEETFTESDATVVIKKVTEEIIASPAISAEAKFAVAEETVKAIESSGSGEGNSVPVVPGLSEIRKILNIFNKLEATELVNHDQAMAIVSEIYPLFTSGDEISANDIIDIVLFAYDLIIKDLAVEDQILLLFTVYGAAKEEYGFNEQDIANAVSEYYDDALAYAYALAYENGYVDIAVDALYTAIEAIEAAKTEVENAEELSSSLKDAVNAELDLAIASVRKAIGYIDGNPDMTFTEFSDAVMSYETDLYAHLEAAGTILEIAGSEALDKVNEIWNNHVKPEMDAFIEAVEKNSFDHLEKLFVKIGPVIGEALWEALLSTPEKIRDIIDFVNTYGPHIEAVINEYGTGIVTHLAEMAVAFGLDSVATLITEGRSVLEALAAFTEEHGEEVREILYVYAGAIGLANESIAVLEDVLDIINCDIAGLEWLLDELERRANELGDEIIAAAGEAQAELERQLAAINLQIEEIKKQINELRLEAEAVLAELLAIADAAKVAMEAVAELVEAIKSASEDSIISAAEAVGEALENIRTAAESAKKLAKHIEMFIDKLDDIINAISDGFEFIAESMANLANYITELNNSFKDVIDDLEDISVNLAKLAQTVSEKAEEIAKNLADFTSETVDKLQAVLKGIQTVFNNAVSAEYTFTPGESYYVALGDKTTAQGAQSYAGVLANMLGMYENYSFTDLTGKDLGFNLDEALKVIDANKKLIAGADLITFNYNRAAAYSYLSAGANGKTDWTTVFGSEVAAGIEDVVQTIADAIRAPLAELISVAPGFITAEEVIGMIELYVYTQIARMITIHKVVDKIHEIAPDALIVIVGAYNEFDGVTFNIAGESFEIGQYFDVITEMGNASSFMAALLNENTVFVPTGGVETNIMDNNGGEIVINDYMNIFDTVFNLQSKLIPSAEGNVEIAERIYDAIRPTTADHTHTYGYRCDETCDVCGAVRDVIHTYDNACDGDCNICGAKRTPGKHEYSSVCDEACNICGYVRDDAEAHVFGEWKVEREPTLNVMGLESRTCTNEGCEVKETQMINVLVSSPVKEGSSAGLIVGIAVPSALVFIAGGFSGYWFVYKKRTLKELKNVFVKLFKGV